MALHGLALWCLWVLNGFDAVKTQFDSSHADKAGFILDGQKRLRVIAVKDEKRNHRYSGKHGLNVDRPAMK